MVLRTVGNDFSLTQVFFTQSLSSFYRNGAPIFQHIGQAVALAGGTVASFGVTTVISLLGHTRFCQIYVALKFSMGPVSGIALDPLNLRVERHSYGNNLMKIFFATSDDTFGKDRLTCHVEEESSLAVVSASILLSAKIAPSTSCSLVWTSRKGLDCALTLSLRHSELTLVRKPS